MFAPTYPSAPWSPLGVSPRSQGTSTSLSLQLPTTSRFGSPPPDIQPSFHCTPWEPQVNGSPSSPLSPTSVTPTCSQSLCPTLSILHLTITRIASSFLPCTYLDYHSCIPICSSKGANMLSSHQRSSPKQNEKLHSSTCHHSSPPPKTPDKNLKPRHHSSQQPFAIQPQTSDPLGQRPPHCSAFQSSGPQSEHNSPHHLIFPFYSFTSPPLSSPPSQIASLRDP